ncbi:40S ribosomal protein S7-like [Telopea speciosissima]|uniref:40S ribosomal protein S7-like n=1 Tax=Telopea speciosissima TaxID=54955 RepID=UPI001CC357EC|nr:40S ribosomal protein S7-like [Telopea speciosissima]
MDVAGNRKAVVVHVPYRLRKAFRKIHPKLVRELEKMFSGKEDIVYPSEIIGKRVRYCIDGSKINKIFLDSKERNATEYKSETFSGVYKKLAGKDVVFEYPTTKPIHSTKKPFQRRNREKEKRNERAQHRISIGNSSGCGGGDGDDGIWVFIVE